MRGRGRGRGCARLLARGQALRWVLRRQAGCWRCALWRWGLDGFLQKGIDDIESGDEGPRGLYVIYVDVIHAHRDTTHRDTHMSIGR